MFRKDRQGSKRGGVIYAKDTFNCSEILVTDENDLEFIGLNVSLSPQMSFILVVIYRPPSTNVDFYEKLDNLLKQFNPAKELIILGDLNVNWEVKQIRKNLQKVMDKMDMDQVINGATRITNSTSTQIDLAFTNRPERILKSYNMLTGLSDHNLIMVNRKLNKKRFKPLPATESFRIPKQEKQNFIDSIGDVKWDELFSGINLDEDCSLFSNKIQQIITQFTRKIKLRAKKNGLPWLNESILKLMKERDHSLKLAVKSGHNRHQFITLRNRVVREIRRSKADFFITALNSARGNSKITWHYIKKLTGQSHKNKSKQMQIELNRNLLTEPKVIADVFNNYFIKSVTEISENFTIKQSKEHLVSATQSFFIANITETKVIDIIKTLKPSNARDVFGMDTNMLKDSGSALATPIASIINLSISSGHFPKAWKSTSF